MLFLKYRAQSRAGSIDFSSILASSVQRGQNVIDNSQEAHDELYDNQPSPKKQKKDLFNLSKVLGPSRRSFHVNQIKSWS